MALSMKGRTVEAVRDVPVAVVELVARTRHADGQVVRVGDHRHGLVAQRVVHEVARVIQVELVAPPLAERAPEFGPALVHEQVGKEDVLARREAEALPPARAAAEGRELGESVAVIRGVAQRRPVASDEVEPPAVHVGTTFGPAQRQTVAAPVAGQRGVEVFPAQQAAAQRGLDAERRRRRRPPELQRAAEAPRIRGAGTIEGAARHLQRIDARDRRVHAVGTGAGKALAVHAQGNVLALQAVQVEVAREGGPPLDDREAVLAQQFDVIALVEQDLHVARVQRCGLDQHRLEPVVGETVRHFPRRGDGRRADDERQCRYANPALHPRLLSPAPRSRSWRG